MPPRLVPLPLCVFVAASFPAFASTTVLPPTVVTATRSEKALDETPVRTEVVTGEEIRRTNARTLRDALENVPGLQLREIHGKSGFEVSLQGLGSDHVLVLVDGLPLAASTGSTVDVSQYLLGEVEHIEVVKGASSAQYGSSAMGGVINIITRRIKPGLAGELVADAGTYGRQNHSGDAGDIGSAHGQFRIEGGGEQVQARLVVDSLDSAGFGTDPAAWTRQGDAVRREQAGGRLAWQPSARSELWLDGSAYREQATQRYLYFVPPLSVPQRKTEQIERQRLGGGGSWRFDNKASLRLTGLDERYESHSRAYSNDYLVTDRRSTQQNRYLGLQFDPAPWAGQLWQFGADYRQETLAQDANGSSELAQDAARSSRELFVQNDILALDDWEFLLGLRWQNDSDFGSKLAPKLALARALPSVAGWGGRLRASVGQGYRVPNLKERHYLFDHSNLGYVVIGNPDLKPESSDSYQLGVDFQHGATASLGLNVFHNRVRDLIQTDLENYSTVNGIARYSYENIARARTQGVETSARWQLARVGLNAAYTFTHTRDLARAEELTRRPRHIARLGADWQLSAGTTLALRARFQSSELVDSASRARSPGWETLDFNLNHRLGRGLDVFVGMKNMFNRQRDFADANDFGPVSGRYTYLGLRYVFGAGS